MAEEAAEEAVVEEEEIKVEIETDTVVVEAVDTIVVVASKVEVFHFVKINKITRFL